MPRDTYVFEVAVYRVAPDVWAADSAERVEATERDHIAVWLDRGKTPTAEDKMRANMYARYAERPYGWQYNEVVGWIRLLWDGPGPVVKGYLWQVGKKTLRGGEPRRRYQRGFIPFPFVDGEPQRKVLEEWLSPGLTDGEIRAQLRRALLQIVAPDGDLPRRYIDLSVFDALAPYVRWRALLKLEDP